MLESGTSILESADRYDMSVFLKSSAVLRRFASAATRSPPATAACAGTLARTAEPGQGCLGFPILPEDCLVSAHHPRGLDVGRFGTPGGGLALGTPRPSRPVRAHLHRSSLSAAAWGDRGGGGGDWGFSASLCGRGRGFFGLSGSKPDDSATLEAAEDAQKSPPAGGVASGPPEVERENKEEEIEDEVNPRP